MPRPHKSSHKSAGERGDNTNAGPRPTWSGSLSFGLVTIPVELYSASRPPALRAHTVTEDGVRLLRKYYCPKDDRDLEPGDLVRGAEVEAGTYVIVDDAELEALAPKQSREIELRLFTARSRLHPALFENPYLLAPARDNTAGKAYRLLVEVMHRQDRAGIATFVLRERAYIIAIVSDGRSLLGETLRFADEIRSAAALQLPAPEKLDAKRVASFTRALDAKSKGRFDAGALVDPGHARLEKLLDTKRRKGEVVMPPEPAADESAADGGEVVDLMRLLKESLQQGKKAGTRASKASAKHAR